ncbi:hypothetical protein [Raoultibacter phocaeensis]|uniref:hypothetical protein n=1 Tax=Raoultibacter phocaeensis TaxID=2479841 RepID=UPI00111B1A19|nr:hypothetical protein [Raoultibacter phocaeensis]
MGTTEVTARVVEAAPDAPDGNAPDAPDGDAPLIPTGDLLPAVAFALAALSAIALVAAAQVRHRKKSKAPPSR